MTYDKPTTKANIQVANQYYKDNNIDEVMDFSKIENFKGGEKS